MTPVPGSVDYSATPPAPLRPASDPPRPLAIEVPPELAGLRLDQALARLLPEHSRSRLQDWIRRERVQVDGASAQPRQKVWGGEFSSVENSGVLPGCTPMPMTSVSTMRATRAITSMCPLVTGSEHEPDVKPMRFIEERQ